MWSMNAIPNRVLIYCLVILFLSSNNSLIYLPKLFSIKNSNQYIYLDYSNILSWGFLRNSIFLLLAQCVGFSLRIAETIKQKKGENMEFSILEWLAGVLAGHIPEEENKSKYFLSLKWYTCSETWNKQIKYFCQLWPHPQPTPKPTDRHVPLVIRIFS